MYEFTDRAGDLEELVLTTFDQKLFLPNSDPDYVSLFQNGDRMDINLKDRTMVFDSPTPTEFTSSRLNFKRHVWFTNGLIRKIPQEKGA